MKSFLMLATLFFVMLPIAAAEDAPNVPQKAIREMKFLVGKWSSTGTFNGEKMSGEYEAKWAPGEYCVFLTSTFVGKAAGVGGWDAEKEQYVEYWYNSNGIRRTFFYTLVNDDLWEGTWTEVDTKGKTGDGKIRLEKSGDTYTVTATGKSADGTELEVKVTTKRR